MRLVSSQVLQVKYRADKHSIRQFSITLLTQLPRNKQSRLLSRVLVRSQEHGFDLPTVREFFFPLVARQP
jgi:hypothetical protein